MASVSPFITGIACWPGQAPFHSSAPLVAFSGLYKEKPAIFAHVTYGLPLPTISYVVIFLVKRPRGHYGTRLIGSVPRIADETLFPNGVEPITAFDLNLGRHYFVDGRPRSYLSACCPARPGPDAFPVARMTYGFEDGQQLSVSLPNKCQPRGRAGGATPRPGGPASG